MHTVAEEPFSTATKRETFSTVGTRAEHMLFFTPMLQVVIYKYITQTTDKNFVQAKQYTEMSFYIP